MAAETNINYSENP